MSSWEEIGEKWNRAQQMGWQAVQAAMEVGEDLQQKKLETAHGEWAPKLKHALNLESQGSANVTAANLMRLALHRNLIEETKPESQRAALALLPKVPRKTGGAQMKDHQEDLDKYESFAKKSAKDQAKVLALKMVKVELDRLQNDAHDAVMAELKASKAQLEKDRKQLAESRQEVLDQRLRYQDLLNKRANGHDFKQALKVLRQAVHPDRTEISASLQQKAMQEIKFIGRFLDV